MRAFALALSLAAAGCVGDNLTFDCDSTHSCGPNGVCLNGGCAFAATDCPSGLRFDKSAKTSGGECVPGNSPLDLSGDFATKPIDLAGVDTIGLDFTPEPPDLTMQQDFARDFTLPCVPTGAEDCFNGIDDDCNGLTDCEDTNACAAIAECVGDETGNGFQMGTTVASGMACPAQYSASSTSLNQGLNAPGGCTGCSCNGAIDCRTTIHVEQTCGGTQGTAYTLTSGCNSTVNVTTGAVHIDTITVVPVCNPSGTPQVPALSWNSTTKFCQTTRFGAGCSPGSVCVPKVAVGSHHCIAQSGAQTCGGNYAALQGGTWYSGVNDTRSCGAACQCSAPTGGSCGSSFVALSVNNNACAASPTDNLNPNGDRCGLDSPLLSGKVTLQGTTAASCVDMTSQSGTATPTGQYTVCCQ